VESLSNAAYLWAVRGASEVDERSHIVDEQVLARYRQRGRKAKAAGVYLPEDFCGILVAPRTPPKSKERVRRGAVVAQSCICQDCGAAFIYDRPGGRGHVRRYCEVCTRERDRVSNCKGDAKRRLRMKGG
jgi:hypothetical protein